MSKKILLTAMMLLAISFAGYGQLPKETPEQKAQRMKWWTDARFGMFIH